MRHFGDKLVITATSTVYKTDLYIVDEEGLLDEKVSCYCLINSATYLLVKIYSPIVTSYQ